MKPYKHLGKPERELIFLYVNQGKSLREIGKLLGRSHVTIGREIKRNGVYLDNIDKPNYFPSQADGFAIRKRLGSKKSKLDAPAIQRYVIDKLTRHWSPEQIAGRLKIAIPDCAVSYETIYKFIYDKSNRSLRLWEFLRKAHGRRQLIFSRKIQTAKRLAIPNKTSIEQRPKEANLRLKVGHWESDNMEGSRTSKDAVSVTTDRKSLYVLLDKLPSKETKYKISSLNERFSKMPAILKRTITFDNGSENYDHQKLVKQNGVKTYFCNPYHSWEKGTVENTVEVVREYYPKGMNLSQIDQKDLNAVERELNNRPRKKLGFYTPTEFVYKEINWCA
jgi:IS30 family transposase